MLKLNDLQQWLQNTPLGRTVLATEEVFYHTNVQKIFGYYALQIGLPQINFLSDNKISARYIINHDIQCDLRVLPFENNSIDLIICPHTLELTDDYHHFLQECYRVLIPKGKIIITGFNPKSLFGLFGRYNPFLKKINYISVHKLQQQLTKLKFHIWGGRFFSYIPPINKDNYLQRLDFLNKIGDRWLPTFANCYGIVASKELVTPTFIRPKRQTNLGRVFAPGFAPTAKTGHLIC